MQTFRIFLFCEKNKDLKYCKGQDMNNWPTSHHPQDWRFDELNTSYCVICEDEETKSSSMFSSGNLSSTRHDAGEIDRKQFLHGNLFLFWGYDVCVAFRWLQLKKKCWKCSRFNFISWHSRGGVRGSWGSVSVCLEMNPMFVRHWEIRSLKKLFYFKRF